MAGDVLRVKGLRIRWAICDHWCGDRADGVVLEAEEDAMVDAAVKSTLYWLGLEPGSRDRRESKGDVFLHGRPVKHSRMPRPELFIQLTDPSGRYGKRRSSSDTQLQCLSNHLNYVTSPLVTNNLTALEENA